MTTSLELSPSLSLLSSGVVKYTHVQSRAQINKKLPKKQVPLLSPSRKNGGTERRSTVELILAPALFAVIMDPSHTMICSYT